MSYGQSALVVLIPEAETLVKSFREKFDPSAAAGMPAHVTLLYPFKSPHEVSPSVLEKLQSCFASFSRFDFLFTTIKRFPETLYLAPKTEETFRELTNAIWRLYPETPPYEGKHADIKPHLTVAQVTDGKRLDQITDEFALASKGKLPIQGKAKEIALMDTKTGRWQTNAIFNLG